MDYNYYYTNCLCMDMHASKTCQIGEVNTECLVLQTMVEHSY